MGADNQGKTWFVFDGVHPNPVEEDVRQAAAALRGAMTSISRVMPPSSINGVV